MRTHPYRLIGDRLKGLLTEKFMVVVEEWGEDWLPEGASCAIETLIPLSDYCLAEGKVNLHSRVSWVDDNWCGLMKPVYTALFGAMLFTSVEKEKVELSSSILLHEVAKQALLELAQRILSADQSSYDSVPFFVADNQLPEGAGDRGSGALVLGVKVGRLKLRFIVSPLTIERYIKALESPPSHENRKKLVDLTSAISDQRVSAKVVLGSAELTLGELSSIRIGDVITLDKSINQPALLRVGISGNGCEGFIGTFGESLAFRVSDVEHQNS
jgi:hypothetical protein